jgi:hypothetical protein
VAKPLIVMSKMMVMIIHYLDASECEGNPEGGPHNSHTNCQVDERSLYKDVSKRFWTEPIMK